MTLSFSLVAEAIKRFREDTSFARLMKSEGLASVVPLIKTEIVITTHNSSGSPGIPLWFNKTEVGSLSDWMAIGFAPTLDRTLIARLIAKLSEGVIQTFVDACQGAMLGELFLTGHQSSCYLSVTDENALNAVGGSRAPTFAEMLPDYGQAIRALKSKASGAQSVTEMGAGLLSRFRKYAPIAENTVGQDPIFAVGDHANPLHSFVYNSADARAEKVLKQCEAEKVDELPAGALLKAGFTETLPPSIDISQDQRTSNPRLDRILTVTDRLRVAYSPYRNIDAKPDKSTYATEMQAFRNCTTSKDPKPEVCGAIRRLVNIASTGTAGDFLSKADVSFLKSTEELITEYKSEAAPTLVAKYTNSEITLSSLFEKLSSLWQKFDNFRGELSSYSNYYYKEKLKGELPADFLPAKAELSKHFSNALRGVQVEFFPVLQKEALEVRLTRIEEAAKLLSLHGQELKGLDAKEELRQLGNDLVCLTAIPVGPAFDAKYAKH